MLVYSIGRFCHLSSSIVFHSHFQMNISKTNRSILFKYLGKNYQLGGEGAKVMGEVGEGRLHIS